ncbi:unnamed protein product [Phytophthora fragariaefolia]|uniref:Unnamed protein product n=1 Tax=Phytophthora fragariaefolia TaxID=1490495 RepID=A0A9W6YBH9_9STRA|nr:unnamed protein product [Phytophthora fragariaefolia]
MRRSLEDSNCEGAEDRFTNEDQSGSGYADPYHSDEHDRHVAAASDAECRAEAVGTYGRSQNRAVAETSPTEGSTAPPATKVLTDIVVTMQWVPIGLPQLASPPVDADCVYVFVGESKWLKTQRREEVKEVNTTEIEKERNGSFGGGESDERKTEEWNSGGSEGLVSSVTQKTWHD